MCNTPYPLQRGEVEDFGKCVNKEEHTINLLFYLTGMDPLKFGKIVGMKKNCLRWGEKARQEMGEFI